MMGPAPAEALLAWYDRSRRDLPWRDVGDPYATWVSEIMLQQTRVETVIPYFRRFMADYPTVAALAAAAEDDVLKHWEGLGYYSRARHLHAGAKRVVAEYGGVLPDSPEALRRIEGIGDYTAGAIASIACGKKAAAVDGNVIRVICRFTGLRENAAQPAVRRAIAARVEALMPEDRPGDFNQALMDLGATVCVPGTPDCGACPWAADCAARLAGDPEDLPLLPKKKAPATLCRDVLLIRAGDRVLVRQRTENMLKGLWVFPMAEGFAEAPDIHLRAKKETGLDCCRIAFCGPARHVFTHQIWEMRLWRMETDPAAVPAPPWRFVTAAELSALALPTAMKAARALAFGQA